MFLRGALWVSFGAESLQKNSILEWISIVFGEPLGEPGGAKTLKNQYRLIDFNVFLREVFLGSWKVQVYMI